MNKRKDQLRPLPVHQARQESLAYQTTNPNATNQAINQAKSVEEWLSLGDGKPTAKVLLVAQSRTSDGR
jgi:hypothetical protein